MRVPVLTGAFAANAFDRFAFDIGISTEARIELGGVDVTVQVRKDALSIRDILNDAPNTASLTFDGAAGVAQVGSSLRIAINNGMTLLFSGSVQTVDLSYEGGRPSLGAWPATAIDDTARANRRRPFGTWTTTSATTVALAIAAIYAPDFDTAVEAGLPEVTVTFDGRETFIACLVRLANLIGGYAKVEDNTLYLFSEDLEDAPDPVDVDHPPINEPPITITTDVSQLRTRVYGKGYGERVPTDIAVGETILPIDDGVQFNALGGQAIAGTTADGATSQHIAYTGVILSVGGTLVGPGAAPANAPTLGLQVGSGVTSGVHDVAVVFVTAVGKSLCGPVGSITVGMVAAPSTAPTAGTATNGTGPDQGAHDYVVTHLVLGGETTPGPVSNAITTSAAVGQLSPPGSPSHATAGSGSGADDGTHSYGVTFVNAQGETQLGSIGAYLTVAPQLVGQLTAPSTSPTMTASVGAGVGAGTHSYRVTFGDAYGNTTMGPSNAITAGNGGEIAPPSGGNLTAVAQSGGGMTVGAVYWWKVAFGNAAGETTLGPYSNFGSGVTMGAGQGSAALTNIPVGPAGTTRRLVYRECSLTGTNVYRLVATLNDNTTTSHTDTVSNAAVGVAPPGSNTTSVPYHVVSLTNIPIGPSGTTNRKVWRDSGGGYKFVAEVSGNLTTTLTDTTPTASLGAAAPTTNTTGQMLPFNQITVFGIPIGPAGTTGRRLYRSYGGAYQLVTAISDNTSTQYLDTKSNAALGVVAPTSNTTGTAVQRIPLTAIPLGPTGTTGRNLYRRFNGSGPFKLVTTIANNTSTTYNDAVANASLGATAPASNTAVGNQIALTAIPTGAAAVTQREIYMSPAGGGTRRRVLTIADNVTTTGTITMSDATLAAQITEPASDTSGLTQPSGQVNPGSTTIPMASASPFATTGGWARLGGGQTVRYTGISGQSITGIPASGPGSIVTTVLYGQQALPAPALLGVTGLALPMAKGAAVHIWVQVDDVLAQTEQAARDGSDGIVEFLITDERRSEPSLIERCQADLALFARPIVTAKYATFDIKTKSGKPVTINLPQPTPIHQTLIIQDVAITDIDVAKGLPPRYTVTASSVRFSLEDTLRRLVAGGQS